MPRDVNVLEKARICTEKNPSPFESADYRQETNSNFLNYALREHTKKLSIKKREPFSWSNVMKWMENIDKKAFHTHIHTLGYRVPHTVFSRCIRFRQ